MSRRKIISGIFGGLLLIVAVCILCRPIYYRLYMGDRIKGNISAAVDGENFALTAGDISGCRSVKTKSGFTQVSLKGGEYGEYGFCVNIPQADKAVNIKCYHFNWWTVTSFDIDIIVDTAADTVTFEGDCSYVDDTGNVNKFSINNTKLLSDNIEVWISEA